MAEKQPKNINNLKEIILEVWNSIPKKMCEKYALRFKRRAMTVYRSKGNHINY